MRRLTVDELHSTLEAKKGDEFDARIKDKMEDSITLPPIAEDDISLDCDNFADPDDPSDNASIENTLQAGWIDSDPIDADGNLVFKKPVLDTLINPQVLLPYGNEMKLTTIKSKLIDVNGDQIGVYHKQPFFKAITYNAEFQDGSVCNFGVNIIAQHLYSQVDEDGRSFSILDQIVDSKQDETTIKRRHVSDNKIRMLLYATIISGLKTFGAIERWHPELDLTKNNRRTQSD